MVTLWWLRLLNSLMQQNAAMKYSEVKWPGLDPEVEWPCVCWQQPFDTEDRGQDKSSVLLCGFVGFWHSLWSSVVALASRDTQTVGWHRNVTETKRLKPPQTILLFVQCLFSLSSLPLPESYAPQVDNFKAYCKPNAMRKKSKMWKTDKSEKGCFWLTMKALHSFQTYMSVSSGLIQNVHSGAHFL